MNVSIEWHDGKYPSFNVNLSSKEGADAFLSIKGCRIVDGSKGQFVSYPATKNEKTGKYWNHAWASEKFNAVVLEKALASMPKASAPSGGGASVDEDIPFAKVKTLVV